MTFFTLLLILSCVYVGSNETIKQESKTGFFVVVGILALIGVAFAIL
jgi:hypothetical protein